jgi:predicted GH43/DUF377 family glycosyl hydrolase
MEIFEELLLKPHVFKPSFRGWKVRGIFNPAAVRMPDGNIMLLIRVSESPAKDLKYQYPEIIPGNKYQVKIKKIAQKNFEKKLANIIFLKDGTVRLVTVSHLKKIIIDKNGFDIREIYHKPVFYGKKDFENLGIEDPRITKIDDKYVMTYVAVSMDEGISTALAVSENLKNWKRKGIIFSDQNKDVVIFPKKINRKYVALHRPHGSLDFHRPSIWVSYSKDLIYWGKEKEIMHPRKNSWDSERVGPGTPPLKTKKGWLVIYHGVDKNKTYNAGAILLDLKNPEKIIARSPKDKPLLKPESKFEKKGFVKNVIFPTGVVEDLDGENLLVYCGAADNYIIVKKILLKDVLESLERC